MPWGDLSKRWSVRQLIEALQQCDPEAMVETEGCDCTGDVGFLKAYPPEKWREHDRPTVLICRSDGDASRDREFEQ